jgi:NTP pyrophosphatase (non-canonical NTP hydrolase)
VARLIENLKPGGSWLLHSQIGLAGEVGELAAAIQRWLYYGKPLDRTNVIEELGDLCWYLAQACRAMDVKLEDVMKANIQKLLKRYPEKYTDFHAAEENRDREQERAILDAISEQSEEAYRQSCLDAISGSTVEFCAEEAVEPYEAVRQIVGDSRVFIEQQTGPRPATPICPRCKTIVSKHGYCPECRIRTV